MKTYLITPKLNFRSAGGSVEEVDLIARDLIALGNEVILVTLFSNGNDISQPLPYRVIEEMSNAKGLWGTQKAVYSILKKYENDADFFHLDGHFFLYGAGLYRRLGGKIPVSVFFNRELNSWPEPISSFFPQKKQTLFNIIKKKIRFYIEKYIGMPLANGIDLFSATCPMLLAEYEKFGLRKDDNSLVLGDPFNWKKLMEDNGINEDTCIKRNKDSGPFTILYSSRMSPGKGFDILLKGFSRVKNKDNFHLILGGNGPEDDYIHQMVVDLGLEKYVDLPGWVSKEELCHLHQEADIFVQTEWMIYGTSMTLLYAMAFGLPAILSGGGGLERVSGGGALYFEYRNPEDLAQKIEQLAADYALREKLSRNCYKRLAEDQMNHEYQIKRLDLAMKDVLAKGRKSGA